MTDSKNSSFENFQESKHDEHEEKDKSFRQLPLNDKVHLIVSELVSNKLKTIQDKYENQQATIDKYNDQLNSLFSSAEKILSNLEKANEAKQIVKTPAPTPSTVLKKPQGQGSLMSQLVGLSTALPVINEAVPHSRLTQSISTLPAQANLSKISQIPQAGPGAARQNRGSKVVTKEEEENQHKPKEQKEIKQEKLQVIDEAPVKPQKESHQKTQSNVPTQDHAPQSKAAVPKLIDFKTQRNLAKNKSMVQLKTEEGVKTDKSKVSDATNSKPERKQSGALKKDDSGQKQKQEDDESKQKIERKPAIPKAGGTNTGSDGKTGKEKLKESVGVSQFNSNDPKSTKSKDAKGKSGINNKQLDEQIPDSAKIIPRKPPQTQQQEPLKQEEQKEEIKVSEKKINLITEEDDQHISEKQNQKQESENQILEEVNKNDNHDDENLLDDIDHKAETAANQEQNNLVEQQPKEPGELDINTLDSIVKDFFEGKVEAKVLSDFCVKNVAFNEQIDEHLIFAQIDLQKIVDDFNTNNPNAGDFSESFQLQSSTKEGLQLIEINFMQEMMEKEEFDESVMNMFEMVFVILNGPELEKYRNAENQENFIREYMNENYDNFVQVIESFEGKVEELNKNYSVKKYIKDYVEKYEFITDQDYYFAIEPLCALLSPVIEEIIVFMGLRETSTNKKNVLLFKYQNNQAQQKRVQELNQIIVNNTYHQD